MLTRQASQLFLDEKSAREGIIVPCYTWRWVWQLLADLLSAKDVRVCDVLEGLKDMNKDDADVRVCGEIVSKGDYTTVNISDHCFRLRNRLVTTLLAEVGELKPAV